MFKNIYFLIVAILLLLIASCDRGIGIPTPIVEQKNYTYENPNVDNPLTGLPRIDNNFFFLNVHKEGSLPEKIGFYNNLNFQLEGVTILIDECRNAGTGDVISYEKQGKYPVLVKSQVKDVEAHESTEFQISIQNNLLIADEKYVCRLKAVKEMDNSEEYESISFFMNIKTGEWINPVID